MSEIGPHVENGGFTCMKPGKFLDAHRHTLVNSIQVDRFVDWLIQKKVFSRADEEDVFYSEKVPRKQAGKLLDIVARKGPLGFQAFMEVLEYEYPDVYTNITNKTPRRPPNEFMAGSFRPRCRSLSTHLLSLVAKIIQSSNSSSTKEKRDILGALNSENDKLKRDFEALEREVGRLRKDKFELSKECEDIKSELTSTKDKLQELRDAHDKVVAQRDVNVNENFKLKEELSTLQNKLRNDQKNHTISSLKERVDDLEKLCNCYKQELDSARQERDRAKRHRDSVQRESSDKNSKNQQLLAQIEDLNQRITSLKDENRDLVAERDKFHQCQTLLRTDRRDNAVNRRGIPIMDYDADLLPTAQITPNKWDVHNSV